jgi:long-chain fatty acid transport protein
MPAAPTSARPSPPCDRRSPGPRATGLAVLALALGSTEPAGAAGFAAARFGGEHGDVTSTDPTALYYNPGAIALGSGTHLILDGVLALRGASWEHTPAPTDRPDPPGAAVANSGRASLFNVFGAPMAGATTRLGGLALGGAVSVPFGGRSHWSSNPALAGNAAFPLAADGVQRWHSVEGALTFIYFTAGVAYRLGPLALGLSGNLIRSSVSTSQAKNPTGNGDPDTTREGRITVDVSGTSASFGVGLAAEPLPGRLWLGLSYQAQPGLGPMSLRGRLATTYQGTTSGFPVTLTQALPDVWRLGARFRPVSTVELRLHADRTRWSVLDTQCVALEGRACAVTPDGGDATSDGTTIQNVRRRWRDTAAVHAGGSLWVTAPLELFAGAGYETGAVPDSTLDPGLFDADNVSLALGARLQLGRGVHLRLGYTHLRYAGRDNVGKSELASAELPTRRADGGGRYTLWLGLIDVGLEAQF